MSDDPFLPLTLAGTTVHLAADEGLPATVHVFERDAILAINTAIACNRPLLIKGEPGSGKSQVARAAAQQLGRRLITKFVDARTEAHDLLWSQDAVSRLAEAQTIHASGGSLDKLARSRFVVPGPLWWAINWQSAKDHVDKAEIKPTTLPGTSPKGMVVLLDEIDKADSSVPNGLLECLGQQTFAVPGLDEPIVAKPPLPLVLLTSNDERPLPRAFVRRCVVLHLRLPSPEQGLVAWLAARGRAHFGGKLGEAEIVEAAEQVVRDRNRVDERHRPGLAEYIDLLTALHRGVGRGAKQPIAALATFVLRKYDDPGEAPL